MSRGSGNSDAGFLSLTAASSSLSRLADDEELLPHQRKQTRRRVSSSSPLAPTPRQPGPPPWNNVSGGSSGGGSDLTHNNSFWTSNREAVAIVGGVIGFWGGVFLLGIIYLIFVCVRRLRKGIYRAGGPGHRPALREDQLPRERKRRAHHYQNFYGSGSRSAFGGQSGTDSGISLTRLGFGTDRGRQDGFSTGMYPSSGGGARIKFGGVSFRSRDMHEPVASSQL